MSGDVRGSGLSNTLAVNVHSQGLECDTDILTAFGTEPTLLIFGENSSGNGNDTYYGEGLKTWTTDDQS